MTFQFAMKGN